MFAHNVYFSLNDTSEAAKTQFVAVCRKYLAGHPGTLFFAVGPRATDCDRPVNDRDFDVALQIVFEDKAAQDRYQQAKSHLRFIDETKPNWKNVRVFDAYVEG